MNIVASILGSSFCAIIGALLVINGWMETESKWSNGLGHPAHELNLAQQSHAAIQYVGGFILLGIAAGIAAVGVATERLAAQSRREEQWSARSDALLEAIEKNTRTKKP